MVLASLFSMWIHADVKLEEFENFRRKNFSYFWHLRTMLQHGFKKETLKKLSPSYIRRNIAWLWTMLWGAIKNQKKEFYYRSGVVSNQDYRNK